ncbi:DUF3592 domain-containing protein [Hamadaea sp. NPDC051192]|uniref:DUF3592 domain-containing protein n=1 Tax=Hamadaea sp. NPDC051192 TaxID=3154940 RepID=UPI003446CA2E
MGVVAAVVAVAWAVIALLCLLAGVRRMVWSERLRRSGIEAAGTIVESQFRSGFAGRVWYRPVVSFRTQGGQRILALGPVRRRSAYPRRAPVLIRYRADKPTVIEIVDGPGEGPSPAGYLFAGLLLLVVLVTFAAAVG